MGTGEYRDNPDVEGNGTDSANMDPGDNPGDASNEVNADGAYDVDRNNSPPSEEGANTSLDGVDRTPEDIAEREAAEAGTIAQDEADAGDLSGNGGLSGEEVEKAKSEMMDEIRNQRTIMETGGVTSENNQPTQPIRTVSGIGEVTPLAGASEALQTGAVTGTGEVTQTEVGGVSTVSQGASSGSDYSTDEDEELLKAA
jgi:hypothetical protein